MKKFNKLTLIILMLGLIIVSCTKKDARNIRPNTRYRVVGIWGPGNTTYASQLFPRSEMSRIIFVFERDKVAKFYLENQDWADPAFYWNYQGDWGWDWPKYEYDAAATYDDHYHRLNLNFEVPMQYQNTTIGAVLSIMSASYSVDRTNGVAIGNNETDRKSVV